MAQLERYGHGGDRWTASELFGKGIGEFLDFSSNINPLGPPASVIRALQHALNNRDVPALAQYPDPRSRGLKAALADRYGVEPEQLVIGNGGAELIDLMMTVFRPRRVGVIHPSFAEYEAAARKRNVELMAVKAGEERGFQPDPVDFFRMVRSADLVFVGQPNNPTGLLIPREVLLEAAEVASRNGTVLVVDEAFIDFVVDGAEHSLLKDLDSLTHMVLLRSMTKFYALPGIRLGYAVTRPDWAGRMEEMKVPWSVNGLAQIAGEAALSDAGFEADTRRWLAQERRFLPERLSRISGIRVIPGEVNYLLLSLDTDPSDRPASRLQELLGRRGILIRDCSTYPGLDGRFFRVAIRSRRENERLLDALRESVAGILEGCR